MNKVALSCLVALSFFAIIALPGCSGPKTATEEEAKASMNSMVESDPLKNSDPTAATGDAGAGASATPGGGAPPTP